MKNQLTFTIVFVPVAIILWGMLVISLQASAF